MGPKARDVLQSLTRARLSNAAFPFGRVPRITVAGAPVLALRVTYVGELGWELHIPVEFAASVYDALMEAGTAARHRQCRLPRHRVAAAGEGLPRLGRRHRPRPLAARGRPRLGGEAKSGTPPSSAAPRSSRSSTSRCRGCSPASPPIPRFVLLGRETIYRDGKRVGWLTSGGYGYTVGRAIGYGYVRDAGERRDARRIAFRQLQLEVATERVPAEIFLEPLYDPAMSRIKS